MRRFLLFLIGLLLIVGITLVMWLRTPDQGIPLTPEPQSMTTVKVFFGDSSKESSEDGCQEVHPVARTIPVTDSVARAALEQLLRGPTQQEDGEGLFSSINPGTRLLGLEIKRGTALADFSSELDQDVAGSCRVEAIRAQISETLKQFPTVHDVVISVEGQAVDILQP